MQLPLVAMVLREASALMRISSNKDYSKRCSSISIIQRTVYTYAKPLNMKHMR